jgi:hypothetical protein
MSSSKHFNINKLHEKIDVAVRNAEICTIWHTLGLVTDMKYKEKQEFLSNEYHLSKSRIEDIIRENEL